MNPYKMIGILLASMFVATPVMAKPSHHQGKKDKPAHIEHGKKDKKDKKDKADKAKAKGKDKASEARAKGKDKADKAKAKGKDKASEARAKGKDKAHENKGKAQPMERALQQENRRHARRMARLDRIREVAQASDDAKAVARIDKLEAKENARHDRWMAHYAKVAQSPTDSNAS